MRPKPIYMHISYVQHICMYVYTIIMYTLPLKLSIYMSTSQRKHIKMLYMLLLI